MNYPKLSIIIPIYNAEEYMHKCMDSILAQTFQDFEIICVNDGSTDNSLSIIDEYMSRDGRIRLIDKENGGSLSARKVGVENAKGNYIGFVDADDWVEPEMFQILMHEAKLYSADMVSCGYYIEEDGSQRAVYGTDKKMVINDPFVMETFYSGILAKGFDWLENRTLTPSVWNKLFKKSLLRQVYNKADLRVYLEEDTITALPAVLDSECIVLIPDLLYHYKQNSSSKCYKRKKGILQSYVYVFDELDRISEEHDGILDDQIPYFSLTALRMALKVGFAVESGKQYMFPFDKVKRSSNVIIYGAGQVGSCYYNELTTLDYTSTVYLTDSNPENWNDVILSPNEVFERDYDVVLIAVENESTAEQIRESLIKRGISEGKIFWQKPIVLKDTYSFKIR